MKKIVFYHIPKTAGTALLNLFLKKYYHDYIHYNNNNEEGILECVIDKNKGFQSKVLPSQELIPKIKNLDFHLIIGHQVFRVIELVPNHKDVLKVVMFRDPIERVVSHYYYVLRSKEHWQYKYITENNIQLDEYCNANPGELRNNYFNLIFYNNNSVKYNEHSIDDAIKKLLTQYHLIGFQDKFSVFAEHLQNLAGIQKDNINFNFSVNKTKGRPLVNQISSKALESIGKNNTLDIALYEKLLKMRKNGVIINNLPPC